MTEDKTNITKLKNKTIIGSIKKGWSMNYNKYTINMYISSQIFISTTMLNIFQCKKVELIIIGRQFSGHVSG